MNKNIFLDLDLTLAKFPEQHGELGSKKYRTEAGFFAKLKPYSNIEAVNAAIAANEKTFVLTNSPTQQADTDKQVWMNQFLPAIPQERRIFNRGGLHAERTKAEVAEEILGRKLTKNDILVDDSMTNVMEWQAAGGTAIWKKNKGKTANWNGETLSRLTKLAKLISAA